MTEPVDSPSSSQPVRSSSAKEGDKPDAEKFDKAMKKVDAVAQVSESEFEKPDKRPFYQRPEEEDEVDGSSASGSEEFTPTPTPGASPEEPPEGTSGLPQSRDFWKQDPLPDEPPRTNKFQEMTGTLDKKERTPAAYMQQGGQGTKTKSPPPGMVPLNIKKEKEEKKAAAVPWQPAPQMPMTQRQQGEEEATQQPLEEPRMGSMREARTSREKEQKKPAPFIPHAKKEAREKRESHLWEREGEASMSGPLHSREEREERKIKHDDLHRKELVIPSSLPPAIQSATAAAQIAAAPYLSPQTAALFSQLIGSLLFVVSSTPGITRTEITLNSDPFLNSTFFNSTIVLEKYATAPDSFNIRLQGTPEAVKLFQENSSLLMGAFSAAYQDRRIHFRVGRLDTAIERHLVHRKEERDEERPQ